MLTSTGRDMIFQQRAGFPSAKWGGQSILDFGLRISER